MKDKIILIQGAMDIEIQYLVNKLENVKHTKISGYEFYEGIIHNKHVVISKTLIGTINSCIATTIGVTTFNPCIVISQGIAGAHRAELHTGDIIIGAKCCNINSYSMPEKAKGSGSNPFEWEPDKRAKDIKYADSKLIDVVYNSFASKANHKIYIGILGSGDVFNREFDRITWINNTFGNDCEDMESISTYSVCDKFSIPCIGVRIISNNELLLEKLDEEKAIELQKLMVDLLKVL